TATIENNGLLPTHSSSNLKFRIDPPDYIFLEGGKPIAGMIVLNKDMNINREQKENPQKLEIDNIPGNSRVKVKWIVKDGSRYTVRVESVKGGRASGLSE
ncbi:MAG: hypothetical protein ACM3NR_00675, partial [Methanosarcina sp.]